MERPLVEIIDDGVNPDWDGSVRLDIPPGKELDVITDRVGYEFIERSLRREASDPEYQQHDDGAERERE